MKMVSTGRQLVPVAVAAVAMFATLAEGPALGGTPAAAQSSAEVFLLPFEPLGPGVSSTVVNRINENVQRRLQMERVNFTTEVSREAAASGGAAAVREAQQEYQRGIGLYVVQDYQGALTAFESSVAAFGRGVSDIQDFRAVPDALFKLAESYYRTGNEDMARITLMRALVIRPEAPPAEEAGQAFGRFYESVRESMARLGRGSIVVESNPPGLVVVVNGEERGSAPVTVTDLPVGEHYVQVRGGDQLRAGQMVGVQRNREMEVRLDAQRSAATQAAATADPRYLRSLRESVQRGTISDSLIPFMRELSARQGVQYVVVGVIVRRDRTFEALPFVYRASDSLFAEIPPQEYDDELANLSAHSMSQAQLIRAALRRFPEDRLVTGAPIIEVEEEPLPGMAAVPTQEEDDRRTMVAPVVVATPARERPRTGAEPAPPVQQQPPVQPAPVQQQPAQQQPAWGQQPAQQPAQQQPA
ncbi:MAG: PEGA domain-containing protein, partial [Deltaproteobacteria bacterium]